MSDLYRWAFFNFATNRVEWSANPITPNYLIRLGERRVVLILQTGADTPNRIYKKLADAPKAINWQDPSKIKVSSTMDTFIDGGAYLFENSDPGVPMFNAHSQRDGNGYRLVIRNARLKSTGAIARGAYQKPDIENCDVTILRPTGRGQSMPRWIWCDLATFANLRFNTIRQGRGIQLTAWDGVAPYPRPTITIANNQQLGFDGRMSDGAGSYLRSHLSANHVGKLGYFASDLNKAVPRDMVGWDVSNFAQLSKIYGSRILIARNLALTELHDHTEDGIGLYGGTGGTLDNWALLEDNLIDSAGGWDWLWDPEDPSDIYYPRNNFTQADGAFCEQARGNGGRGKNTTTGPNTQASGTSILLQDGNPNLGIEYAGAYIMSRRNIGMGSRASISINGGHHITHEGDQVYHANQRWDGVKIGWSYTGFGYAKGDRHTEWYGYVTTRGIRWYTPTVSAETAWANKDAQQTGSTTSVWEDNYMEPQQNDMAGVVAAWRSRMAAAGQQIGCNLN